MDKLASCGAYAFCSIAMVLANKGLASYAGPRARDDHGLAVLPVAFQSLCAVSLLEFLRATQVCRFFF